jgi:hypothetical protein
MFPGLDRSGPGARHSTLRKRSGATVARTDQKEAINSYITDMLSLEEHIEKAIRSQLRDLKEYPDVTRELQQIHRKVEHHMSDLKALAERRDATGGAAEAVKRVGAALAGFAAGAVDLFRNEGLPKNLRDDYTAFSLATIGYVMLHTTGLALDDREAADLARQHFTDYAHVVVRIHALVPRAVIRHLQEQGLPASESVLPEVSRTVEEGWRAQPAAPVGESSVTSGRPA